MPISTNQARWKRIRRAMVFGLMVFADTAITAEAPLPAEAIPA